MMMTIRSIRFEPFAVDRDDETFPGDKSIVLARASSAPRCVRKTIG